MKRPYSLLRSIKCLGGRTDVSDLQRSGNIALFSKWTKRKILSHLFRTVMVKFARAEPAALRPLRSTNKSTFWENNWYEYEMKSLFSSNNNEVQIVDCRTKLNVPPPGFHKLVRNIICGFELVTYVNCVPFYHRILNLSFKKENWIENQELNHRPPPGFHKLGLGIFLMRPQFSIELHFQPLHIYPLIRIPTFLEISILFCVVNFV